MSDPVLIVVQARTGSTRLPGKVLKDLGGKPVLARMIERLRRVKTDVRLIVATTTERPDDAIVALAQRLGVDVFRGDALDLLDRHYRAALAFEARVVAKIPSDCPLIDPAIVDRVLTQFAGGDWDYVSNLHPASYPDGNDIEVMRLEVLEAAWREATLPMEREHTTPFIWERPERFRLGNVQIDETAGSGRRDYSMSYRWTLDYPEDYRLIREIFERLYPTNADFGWRDIMDLLDRNGDLAAINARHLGVNWYHQHLQQLKTIDSSHTRPG